MKPIEQLRKYIKASHPQAVVTLTAPLNKEGVWSLDVVLGDRQLFIEWSLATGFGLSTLSEESYGERSDETFRTIEDVQGRISELLTSNERTSPPLGVLLSRLRERKGWTQQELASKLGIRQATVSGMERRDDVQFSTLRRVIEALGGVLEIFAVFPDGKYRLTPRSAAFSIEPLSDRSETPPETSSNLNYEDTFEALHESGELSWARKLADDISSRHAVLEMVD